MAELLAESVLETRTLAAEVELREVEGEAPVLRGYAATFNQPYAVGPFDERIHPKAFDTTLRGKPDVALLVDHEGQPLARTTSPVPTLRLKPDATGLGVEADLNPDDPDAQKLMAKMRHGVLDKMSFAFRVPPGGDDWDYNTERPQRQLREVSLAGGDVSVVTYPANAGTSVQLRAADDAEASWVLYEGMCRELRSGNRLSDDHMDLLLATQADLGLADSRATVSTADQNDLPDSDFAYIEPGGTKDAGGKTVPRSLRHFPIMDADHVRNALARMSQSPFGDKAKAAILAAAKKFDIDVSEANSGMPLDLALRIAAARRNAA